MSLPIGTSVTASLDSKTEPPTIRHAKCAQLLAEDCETKRCSSCVSYRKTLHAMLSRHDKSSSASKTAPDSHVNYRYLSTPEKVERLSRLHTLQRQTNLRLQRMKAKIEQVAEEKGIEVDEATHNDLTEIMKEASTSVNETVPVDSFQKLFWEQQQKASSLKDSRSMRWHPLMIKWCLYLRHLSGRAYEMLRESGCVLLPSQRTLRDYTHYISASTGFSAEVDKQLIDAAKVEVAEEWQRCVALVIDEMHIKEDLVYDKHSGALVGFVNLGDTNECLLQFEHSMESGTDACSATLAKTMMVFMVRGLFTKLEFPYVQFPCASLSGDLLFDPLWEAIYRLERSRLKVLAVTADGASTNRRLFRIHYPKAKAGEVLYKVVNHHSPEKRFLFFFSDPPHLLKTVRNAWANPKRHLWVSISSIH